MVSIRDNGLPTRSRGDIFAYHLIDSMAWDHQSYLCALSIRFLPIDNRVSQFEKHRSDPTPLQIVRNIIQDVNTQFEFK